jgi:hypothetical protein
MNDYNIADFTFEALCLHNKGPKIDTLAYLVGLVNSVKHPAGNPDIARYKILYPLSEGEHHMETPEDLLDWSAQILVENYFPQTPVMFVQRWSPIVAMIEKGFEPESLARLAAGPHAVASGIWKPNTYVGAKNIDDCESDEELFWSIMTEAFKRAKDRDYFVNIIAQVGWGYDRMIGGLAKWDDDEVAKSGRILWKRTWLG